MESIIHKPLLSIIVPMYNVGKYIEACVKSIEDQTYLPIELILVNDGSADNTLDVAQQMAEKYNNITVLTQQNQGQGAARNLGLANAKGDLIAFIDADDFIEKEMMEKLALPILHENLDFAECSYRDVYCEQGRKSYIYFSNVPANVIISGKKLYESHPILSPCNRVYSHSFLRSFHFKFTENRFAEDVYDISNIILHAKRIIRIDACYYYYRRDNFNSTRNNRKPIHKIKLGCDKLFIAAKLNTLHQDFRNESYISNLIIRNILGSICSISMFKTPGYKNAVLKACKEYNIAKVFISNVSFDILWKLSKVAFGKFFFNKD